MADVSGEGQTLDVCLTDSGYSYTEIPITAYHGAGIEPKRGGGGSAPPSGQYPCKDGWVLIAVSEHTEEVLGSLFGYSDSEIADLYAKEVIGNWDHYDDVPG